MGALWALTGGVHDATALAVRDTELVRVSRGAFEAIAAQHPRAIARLLQGMAAARAPRRCAGHHLLPRPRLNPAFVNCCFRFSAFNRWLSALMPG